MTSEKHSLQVSNDALEHLFYRASEKTCTTEDARIFGEEAKNQPCHEVVHFRAAFICAPFRVVLQQGHIEFVKAAGGTDIKGVIADLLDGANASQRQEKAEMVGKIRISTYSIETRHLDRVFSAMRQPL